MAVSKANIILWCTGIAFVILPHLNLGMLSDYKICGDSECESLMSRVQAIRDHRGKDCRFLSFRRGDTIFVYHKLTGKRNELWAGSIDKQFGYFPKDAVQEEQVYATKENIVETQDSDFFCMDEYGYLIDSSHLDSDEEDVDQNIQNQESESSQTTPYNDDTHTESPSTPAVVSTEFPISAEEEDENKNAGDAGDAGTQEEVQEPPGTLKEQGGSEPSYWLGSSVTGWLGLAKEEEETGILVEGENKKETKEMQADASVASSVTGWLGLGGEPIDDAQESKEEDMKTDHSFTSTMSGWLGFGGEEKTDPSTEKEREEEPADMFRSRRMSLDLEGSQLHEEEKEEMGTLGWLGNGLSNTLGFGRTDQESEKEATREKKDRGVIKEEEQPVSGSWLNMGIGDILGYRKDESEVNGSEEGRFKETEENKTLDQENVDTSQSQGELTDEVRTEPSSESKVEETPKDQNDGSNSIDMGTLDSKYSVLPEDAESKVDVKDMSPKTINGKDHQMPKSIEKGGEDSNGESGEDFRAKSDTDQDFLTQPNLTLGPDSRFLELNSNAAGQSVGEAEEGTTKGDLEEGVKVPIQIINTEASTNIVGGLGAHSRERNIAEMEVLDDSDSMINNNTETKGELHPLESSSQDIGSSHSRNSGTDTLYENASDIERGTLSTSESTTQMENNAGQDSPNLPQEHSQSDGDSHELKETVKEIENDRENQIQPVQTERETLEFEENILNESGLKSAIGLETNIKTEEVGELKVEGNQDEVAELEEEEKQQEVVEIKEQGKQEEAKEIQKEGSQREVQEIQNEKKHQEETKEERKQEEVKDIKDDSEQQEVNEIQEEEEQQQVKKIKVEGKQEEVEEQKEKEEQEEVKQEEVKEIQEEGIQDEVKEIQEEGMQEEVKEIQEEGIQDEVKEIQEEGMQEEVKEIQEEGMQEEVKEIQEEGIQDEVKEIQEEGMQEEVKEIQEDGIQDEVKEIQEEGMEEEVKEIQEEGIQDEVKEIHEEGIQEEVKEIQEEGIQEEVKEIQEEGMQEEVKEIQEEGIQEEVKEIQEEGIQEEVKEIQEEGIQEEVKEIQEEGIQEEVKEIREEGIQEEVKEIREEGIQEEVKEIQEEGIQEEVKEIQEEGIQEEVKEIEEGGIQEEVKEIQEEGMQDEVKEIQEEGIQEEVKEIQEEGIQEEVKEIQEEGKQEEAEGKKGEEEQQPVKEIKHEGKHKEMKEIQEEAKPQDLKEIEDKEKREDLKEIKEEAKPKEEELEEKAKQWEEEEIKEEEELDEMQDKNIEELKKDEKQQEIEVEEEKHKELEGSKEDNEREELEKMEGVKEIEKKEVEQSQFKVEIENNVQFLPDTERDNESPENVEGDIRNKEEEGSLKYPNNLSPQAGQYGFVRAKDGGDSPNTLGFVRTDKDSEQDTTPEKEDRELITEEEQPVSGSWLNMGIGDILGFRKDESQVDESAEGRFKEIEEKTTLKQENTSQSHGELTDEVRTEPSSESKVEETPKDQNDGSNSIDMGTLDSKYSVLPEDAESKVNVKYISPKTINGQFHQMPKSIENGEEDSNGESGEDFRAKNNTDQDFRTQHDLTLGPDSSFVEFNINAVQEGFGRAEDGGDSADKLSQINEGAIDNYPDNYQILADRTGVSLKVPFKGIVRDDDGIQEKGKRDDNRNGKQNEAENIDLLDLGESDQSWEEREINVKHNNIQGNILDGNAFGSEDSTEGGIEVPDVVNRDIISEQTLPSDSQNQKEAETGSGGAFGLFKNAFSFFSETPVAETKESKKSKESTPNLDSNTGETSEEPASLTLDQELESTTDSNQVQELPSSITMPQQQLLPSLTSSETSLPSPESHLQTKTLTKLYKNLHAHMNDDETTILVELFGPHKLQFLDYILGSLGTVNDDPDNDESILLDIEILLLYHREALVAPSMRLADAPQEDKEKTKALIALQKLEMLLERVRETFKSAEASCVGESCSTRIKDKDQATEEDLSVGLDDNAPRDDWRKVDKENGRLSGDTGNEMSTEDDRKAEKGQRGEEERVKENQPGSPQPLEGIMKHILDLVHQIAEDSTTHVHAVKELLIWLIVQVVLALPDDIRPGPDLYGLPWEPVIVSGLVGLVTMLLFTCRFYSSVKSRMYRSRERRMGEQVTQLLDDKCKVLETLSKCQQEYYEVESSLRDSGVLAQTQKTEELEVKARQLEESKRELDRDLEELKEQLEQHREHRIEQEKRIAVLEESMTTFEEETKDLQSQEEQAQTTLKVYSMNSDRLQRNLGTAGEENTLLRESNAQLRQQVEGWAERVSELEADMSRCEVAHSGMLQDVATKDERIMSLTDRLLSMKAWDSELEEGEGEEEGEKETSNGTAQNGKGDIIKDTQGHLQKVQKLIYAAKLNADLKSVDEDKDRLFAKLDDEVKAKEDLQVSIKEMEREKSSLQSEAETYSDQVQKLQQKLQIMTEMYQENELKLHRLLTVEEKERMQKEDKLNKADKNIAMAMEELINYRQRAGEMEEELDKTKQSYQTQMSAHEKKAHNNWLAARAAERELSDIRRENALFRQKLTDTQFKLDALDKDPYALDSLARPLPFRAERSPYGPSPLGRPASETRAFLSPPTLMDGPPARLSPRVPRGPMEPPGGQGEMERIGGPHSDSGSISPTWERDRRGPPPGPPGPLGPPGYMFPEHGAMYRRPPPGALGPLPPPGAFPPGPLHPRGLPPGPPHPGLDMMDGSYRENHLGPGEQEHRESLRIARLSGI
ncbi:transport and Golgi organization protein 1 homolog isoform X3 [Gymnodraco acuticeps]|uniref:Transport and Golgi organization protein 1 homolog isoform X3 n=1 Tax=Gymnodraco acuticeps TaxID=8218 RepID=A0A6P8VCH8_GYMAC|nr:transport and Golgi organization protein 1 homolog isoform X3 [Gymnodraco acuticeps]